MVTLRDMQENKVDFGIKEIVDIVDRFPEYSDNYINEIIFQVYGQRVEVDCISLARVKF